MTLLGRSKMSIRKKARKIVATLMVCCSLIAIRPAHAWIWPTVDFSLIGPFINNITSAVGQVTSAKAQIENYTKTISAIGDQVSAISKYAADLKNTMANITSTVDDVSVNVTKNFKGMDDILQDIQNEINVSEAGKTENATEIVEDIEESIDGNLNEEDVQNILNGYSENDTKEDEAIEQMLQDASNTVTNVTQDTDKVIDMLLNSFTGNGNEMSKI